MRARVVAAVASLAVAATGCGITASDVPVPGGGAGGETYRLTAVFTDALNLPNKAKVKLDGVDIGRVEGMEVDGYNARVSLAILEDYSLPVECTFKLRQTSALGEVYVSVTCPKRGGKESVWHDGDVIRTEHTGQAPGIEDSLAALSLLTNGGGVAQLTTIVRESQRALAGNGGNVRLLLDQLGTVLTTLDGRTDAIGTILERSASIARTVHQRDRTVEAALRDIPPAVEVLADQTDELRELLASIRGLSRVGNRTVTTVRTDVLRMLRALGPTLDGYIALDEDMHRVFADMVRLHRELRRFIPGEAAVGVLEIAGFMPDGDPGGLNPPGGGTLPPIIPGLPQLPLPSLPSPPTLPGLPLSPLLNNLLGLRTVGGTQ